MNQKVTVVILSAGAGKRFWPLSTYKSMVPFLGKPLLFHNLELLHMAGFNDVIIIVNPRDEDEVRKINIPGMNIQRVVQTKPNGMADALLQVKDAIARECLVMSGEDVVDESLYKRLASEIENKKMFVVGKRVDNYFDGGYLKQKGDRLVEIIEKPGQGNEPSSLVNLVFHYFPNPSIFFDALEKTTSEKDDVYEKALSIVLTQVDVRVVSYDGYWQPVKYPWQVLDVMEYMLERKCQPYRGKNVEIKSNVVIEGPVYIEDNVRIFENTKIVGPCYIGKNTIIGNNNIIRHSHIGAGCVTGFNTDITRSYIGDDCWFHSNYVGDSVLEKNVSMGSGSVLANLRLDEGNIFSEVRTKHLDTKRNKLGAIMGKNIRIGVNTSTMPGVKIGQHSLVGAGIVIDKDIPDDSFCVAKSSYVTRQNIRMTEKTSRDQFKNQL